VDVIVQAVVLGVVQGLSEFLPISSSGHLIVVPALLGWTDPFIDSLAFSVMLHLGTLLALLMYFRDDWIRLIPAALASIRDRSLGGDPHRRLAWLIAVGTVPAGIAALAFNDLVSSPSFRQIDLVAVMLAVFAGILWLSDRVGSRTKHLDQLSFPGALGVGILQSLALVPGVSRSGITMTAGLFAGLDRASAARFAFLLATPVTALAVIYEAFKLVRGEAPGTISLAPLVVGVVAAFISGVLAISVLLRYVRTRSLDVFVIYRFAAAAFLVVFLLAR
jgi:undecaprenyl-diphosphatase